MRFDRLFAGIVVAAAIAWVALRGPAGSSKEDPVKTQTPPAKPFSQLTEDEWRRRLTPEQFTVCRLGGTERAGSGKYLHHTAKGTYACAACAQPIFSSDTKYDSGCGWPSFSDALDGAVPAAARTGGGAEAACARCGSHLGHVFDDGPPPTGKRY